MRPAKIAKATSARRMRKVTPAVNPPVSRSKPRLKARKKAFGSWWPGLRMRAQSAGVSVSATMPEIVTEMAIVTANCLYIWPVNPPMKATGTNTAQSTSTMATTGPETSSIALMEASRGPSFSSAMMRSTFSSTTMASSTTMPMASTMPKSVSRLIEKPSMYMPAKVPTRDTGTASEGMRVARKFCRNRYTTRNTSTMASTRVCTTSSIEMRTNVVVS